MNKKREQNIIQHNEYNSNRNWFVYLTRKIYFYFAFSIFSGFSDASVRKMCRSELNAYQTFFLLDLTALVNGRRWHFGLLTRFILSVLSTTLQLDSSNLILTEKNILKFVNIILTRTIIDALIAHTINANILICTNVIYLNSYVSMKASFCNFSSDRNGFQKWIIYFNVPIAILCFVY